MPRSRHSGRIGQICREKFGTYALVLLVSLSSVLCAARAWQMSEKSERHVPSNVAWTEDAIAGVANGNALRGLLLARRCEHCHGSEGFSQIGSTPNLAGMAKLYTWKQLQDFRSGKRKSAVMEPIAVPLAQRDLADLAVYFSVLPAYPDPQDNRSFPQVRTDLVNSRLAARLIVSGDGARGIPPCQACHGPIAQRLATPSLSVQNADYVFAQLEAFASDARSNDIDLPMRTIASALTTEERRALANYYGAGMGLLPAGATVPR